MAAGRKTEKPNEIRVNWKTGHIARPFDSHVPGGYFPYDKVDGAHITSKDALFYMERLIAASGMDMSMLPDDWRDSIRLTQDKVCIGGSSANAPVRIPPGTLYLLVNVQVREGVTAAQLREPEEVEVLMRENPETAACAERLLQCNKIPRVWFDVKNKFYRKDPKGRCYALEYDTPMARLHTKAWRVDDHRFRIQLTPFDIIYKE